MDAHKNNGFAYDKVRHSAIRHWFTFHFGATATGEPAAAGTILDEFHVWHEVLNSQQIWQFYIQGGAYYS